jgi:hypothetical protein
MKQSVKANHTLVRLTVDYGKLNSELARLAVLYYKLHQSAGKCACAVCLSYEQALEKFNEKESCCS